jgi:hypothetical protein
MLRQRQEDYLQYKLCGAPPSITTVLSVHSIAIKTA